MNKYDTSLDMDSENSLSILLRNIKNDSTILEFGPATGRMTKYLKENMNCDVYIVEIDEEGYEKSSKFAVDGLLGDIEQYEWIDKFKKIKFDYILFADVLEHLRNPDIVINKATGLLKEDGQIGISLPNISHNSIIMNLMRNNFQYNQLGLLDNTHIRFFTYETAKNILEKNGMTVIKELATYVQDNSNEFRYNINDMTAIEKEAIDMHDFGHVYQFVFMACKREYYEKNLEKINIVKNIRNDKTTYTLKTYVNTGFGDRDCESIIKSFMNKSNNISFNLTDYKNIKSLRLDFFVSEKCILEIDEILIDGEKSQINNLGGNQIFTHNNIYVFNTNNPYVFIMINNRKVENISIKFKIEKIFDFEILGTAFNEINKEIGQYINSLNENKKIIENSKIAEKNLLEENIQLKNNITKEIELSEKLREEINKYKNEFITVNRDKMMLEMQIYDKTRELNDVLNSSCWKVTKPIRFILDSIKSVLKSNYYTNLFYKGLVYLKTNGVRNTGKKVKGKLKKKKQIVSDSNFETEVMNINDLIYDSKFNKTIAVHVHLYYVDLLDEFISYLNNIPYKFDLFVSCREGSDLKYINEKLKTISKVNNVYAEITINRGRDIAPLYVQFGDRISKYDYFLHIHTKKSLYSGKERYGWRQYSLDCLLGNQEVVKAVFNLFESDKNIGLFIPQLYDDVPALALDWLANAHQGREILNNLGIEFEDGIFTYPVGSFFWAKMDAVKPLFDYKFKYEDFPEEAGQTDGTTAHALERAIAFVSKSRGYEIAIHEYETKNILFGRTLKPFRGYFEVDLDAVTYHLSQYELITFDIFDTLITRCIYKPDDLFKLMSKKIKLKYNLECDFLSIRKKAENNVVALKGNYCNIHDIYNEIPNISSISAEMALEIKQMEIDTELDICIPRYDVLEIFNRLKSYGKKIVLVSDMYLTKDIITNILQKCGYSGYDDLWISCEKGARKDNNTIWPIFFSQYGNYKTIHVGDNMRSDIQILGDQGKETFLILNPITEFKLSRNYAELRKYIDTTVENSIMLGMVVNGGLYNSPFSLQVENAEPLISDEKLIGYIAFGAIFSKFIIDIYKNCDKNSTLLFLAREGYLLEKIYDTFIETVGKESADGIYFLASRRAATVAAIENEGDVRDIIKQYYEGELSNLLRARLGIDLYENIDECRISMPADEEKVMKILKPHMDEIMKNAKKESKAYLEYINSTVKDDYDK
ncbi:MAG: rhamnan synthesis F family protein, partial [Clostridium sp.]